MGGTIVILPVTDGTSRVQPASLPRRMEDVYEEGTHSNANVMYIHVCMCHLALL
jgi:hypothetical protein